MINTALKDFIEAISTKGSGTESYDTQAEVLRVEGKTAWVHIPGGVDETPVELTIDAKAGDSVQVRVANGNAWLTGNGSAPPTDDTTARSAKSTADTATLHAKTAVETAEDAKAAVGEISQHFWHDSTGAHIKDSNGSCQNNLTSEGMSLVDAGTGDYIARFLKDAVRFYVEPGTSGGVPNKTAIEFCDDATDPSPFSPGATIQYQRPAAHGILSIYADSIKIYPSSGFGVDIAGNLSVAGNSIVLGNYSVGVESFTCTRNTTNTTSGGAKGVYDKASGTVRIWGQWANTANTGAVELFAIPSSYRPAANEVGYGIVRTSGDVPLPSNYTAYTSGGSIMQNGSTNGRGGFFYIEYSL